MTVEDLIEQRGTGAGKTDHEDGCLVAGKDWSGGPGLDPGRLEDLAQRVDFCVQWGPVESRQSGAFGGQPIRFHEMGKGLGILASAVVKTPQNIVGLLRQILVQLIVKRGKGSF